MPTQVQIRGSTQATQEARTLATRELDVNTTDKRISIHDGSTVGGTPHSTWIDVQNNEYTYAAGTGTNSITASLNKSPSAYAAGQSFTFKAENTNTGSVTINWNSLGAVTLKKKDVFSGTISTLAAGDIIAGGVYTAHLVDSSNAVLESIDAGGIQSVSQGDLNTSTGTVSISRVEGAGYNTVITLDGFSHGPGGGDTGYITRLGYLTSTTTPWEGGEITSGRIGVLPGGSYGMYPQCRSVNGVGPSDYVFYAQQRYINASPPFDLGDGEVGGFLFVVVNSLGEVVQHYAADVPPWGYNGPTDIRCTYKCKVTGKKYRKAMKKRSLEEILDGVPSEWELQEITHEIKNADMALIPHPFGNVPDGHTVVLIDPMDDKIAALIEYQNAGGGSDISDALSRGLIKADNKSINRKGPNGVSIHPLKYKRTAKL